MDSLIALSGGMTAVQMLTVYTAVMLAGAAVGYRLAPAQAAIARGAFFGAIHVAAAVAGVVLFTVDAGLRLADFASGDLIRFAIYLAAVFWASAAGMVLGEARSVDAFGRRGWGVLAFLPILQIILIFRPSRPSSEPRPSLLPGLAGRRGVAVGMACALVMMILGTTTVMRILVEQVLREQVRIVELPAEFGLGMRLTGLAAEGTLLTEEMTWRSAPSAAEIADSAEWLCGQPDHQALIFMGAVVDVVHKGPGGEDLGIERLDRGRCFF